MSDNHTELPPITRLFLKQFKPIDGSIVILKRPSGVTEDQFDQVLRDMADDIVEHAGVRAILIGVESFSDMKHLDEARMERLGWVRKNRVLAFKDEKFEDLAAREEEE